MKPSLEPLRTSDLTNNLLNTPVNEVGVFEYVNKKPLKTNAMKKLTLILGLALMAGMFAFAQEDDDSLPGKTANYNEVVTKMVKGKLTSYTSKSGEKFTVGDTITLGVAFRNEVFNFIRQYAVIETYPLENTAAGSIVVIKSIRATYKTVWVYTTHAIAYTYGCVISNLDAALENGEVKSKLMSSDDALTELKKCKDKLDLGLITQEAFDLKKQELAKFIK